MEANQPRIVIQGMEHIIERDLAKHKSLLEQRNRELMAFREARSHEIKRKKHYKTLIGQGKYNDTALERSMSDIAVNIRHLSDKVTTTERSIAHHALIVDTLTAQLAEQNDALRYLAQQLKDQEDGSDD